MYVGPLDVCYFWNTLWIIPGHMRYPLDHYAKTTERTLGLPDIRCSGSWWRTFPINRPFHLHLPMPILLTPWRAPRLPKSFPWVLSEKLVKVGFKRSFWERETMSMLSFGVCFVPLYFDLFYPVFCLGNGFQVFIKHFLKTMMFSKGFLKESWFCNFLHCMYYYSSLGKV